MPKLLLFAPCEKVAHDQGNNPVLVSVLIEWTVAPATKAMPENAIIPKEWVIFTLWYRLPEDEGREFIQTCELKAPTGRILLSGSITFRMTTIAHRNTMNVAGLPVTPGQYELSVYLSEKDTVKDRECYGTYPLVVHGPPQPAPAP
jgi:hypothetical protein